MKNPTSKTAVKTAKSKTAKKTAVKTTRKSTLTAKDKIRIYRPVANIAHVSIALAKSVDKSYTPDERAAFAQSAKEKLADLTVSERARYFELHPKSAKQTKRAA